MRHTTNGVCSDAGLYVIVIEDSWLVSWQNRYSKQIIIQTSASMDVVLSYIFSMMEVYVNARDNDLCFVSLLAAYPWDSFWSHCSYMTKWSWCMCNTVFCFCDLYAWARYVVSMLEYTRGRYYKCRMMEVPMLWWYKWQSNCDLWRTLCPVSSCEIFMVFMQIE